MAYSAEISRTNPSCFLFLIDQSGSMGDSIGGGEVAKRKADGVADAVNNLLQNLAIKCAKEEGIRDYFQVGVIGYGSRVGPAFSGPLAGRDLIAISEIGNQPARLEERVKQVEDGAGGLVNQTIRFPIWFDSVSNGGTPMCQAFGLAKGVLQSWLANHPDCFPPTVINITDGEATDGDPTTHAEAIRRLRSNDGEVLLYNLHVSSQQVSPIQFPDSDAGLPDEYARLLFTMSSILPIHTRDFARQEGIPVTDATRGFAFNASLVSVIKFLDIGTRPSNLR